MRIGVALERGRDDARTLPSFPRTDGVARTRRVAVGDPQARFGKFLEILDAHGLLGEDGRLLPEVELVSMGDHFDWGAPEERAAAAASGTELLAWLAAHAADQVTILAGNHDLARVGELARLDDDSFALAQKEADAAYIAKTPSRLETEFSARFGLSSWELASRDFSTFRVEQRTLVAALLQTKRLRVAYAAAPDLLLTHAGVTVDELEALGAPRERWTDAVEVARALNFALDEAVAAWSGGPLSWKPLHAPGDASREGLGMFYHRPVAKGGDAEIPRRRFPVQRLPVGLTQVVGHVRDKKSRALLDAPPAEGDETEGALRHVRVKGGAIAYARGTPEAADRDAATLIFVDGAMNDASVKDYELLDLSTRRAV